MVNRECAQEHRSRGESATPTNRWRLILADDHKILLEGLRRILESTEFEIVAEVENGRALVDAAANFKPDLIVTDYTMPVLNGLEASRQILRHSPKAKILMLSMHNDASYAIEARHAGVRGYVLKDVGAWHLIEAMRKVLNGEVYVEPCMTQAVLNSARFHQNGNRDGGWDLTPRQREVLQMLAEGKQPKEIAGILGISSRTVEFHKYRIMDTLGLHSVPELAVYAAKRGMVG